MRCGEHTIYTSFATYQTNYKLFTLGLQEYHACKFAFK